jgi:hypothetical protein
MMSMMIYNLVTVASALAATAMNGFELAQRKVCLFVSLLES